MSDLQMPQLELFRTSGPLPGLLPPAVDVALTMLLRDLMLSVLEHAGEEEVDE
ncbi:MAG: hypothetical protein JO278_12605 [Dyella sp.]|nr:hypothetical protein [Dyella sp.]